MVSQRKKTEKRSYSCLFPKELLENRRGVVVELNSILKAMDV